MSGQPRAREQSREVKRELRHSERDLERECNGLEREERQLVAEIKAAAAKGNERQMKAIAMDLVNLRKQKDRLTTLKANITAAGHRATLMASQAAAAGAIGSVAKVMGQVNSRMEVKETAKTMQEFQKQTEYMSIREELVDDALMDAFDGEDVQEETDHVVSQVLDEIGLDLGNQMTEAPEAGPRTRLAEDSPVAPKELNALQSLNG